MITIAVVTALVISLIAIILYVRITWKDKQMINDAYNEGWADGYADGESDGYSRFEEELGKNQKFVVDLDKMIMQSITESSENSQSIRDAWDIPGWYDEEGLWHTY